VGRGPRACGARCLPRYDERVRAMPPKKGLGLGECRSCTLLGEGVSSVCMWWEGQADMRGHERRAARGALRTRGSVRDAGTATDVKECALLLRHV
jgi:hypothetical protein